MAKEAVLMIETELPIMMTVADATAIPKGSFIEIANPFTATIHNGANDYCGGIAAEEKIANDGKTKIAVYQAGIFRAYGQAAITTGQSVALSGDVNELFTGTNASLGMKSMGFALTDCGGDNETFIFKLQLGAMANVLA